MISKFRISLLSALILCSTLVHIPTLAFSNPTVIDFSADAAEENQLFIQGAGFGGVPQADVRFGAIPTDAAFPGATDGRGAIIEAGPGEGVMLFADPVAHTKAALIRCSIRVSHANAAVTLASIDDGPDVFVSTNSPNNASAFVDQYRRISVFYAPPSTGFRPVLQVVNQSQTETLIAYVDNMEIYLFGEGEYWSSDFLDGNEQDPGMLMVRREDLQVTPTPAPPASIPTPDPVLAAEGEMFFELPHVGRGGNHFTCMICHDRGADGTSGLTRPGHTVQNSASRPHWKNGNAPRLIDAVNACLSDWMNAETLAQNDQIWKAIEAYLRVLSPDPQSEPIVIQIVSPPNPPTGGDFIQGRVLYQQLACIECHGSNLNGQPDGEGGLIGPFLASRPEIPLDHDYIAAKIRQSGSNISEVYEGLQFGGNMPFWGADRLSDNEVRDLSEYIATASRWTPVPEIMPTLTPTQTPQSSQPTATPQPSEPQPSGPQPGWIADFGSGNAHRVSGTVVIVDEHTLRFENFEYDGGGIAVGLYLIRSDRENFTSSEGRAGATAFDFTLGECFGLNDGCSSGNFTMTVPESINVFDYTHVSVWCIPVGISFGDGRFQPPQ